MRIAFATTLSSKGSTNIGRVEPLAREFSSKHDVHILLLSQSGAENSREVTDTNVSYHFVGKEPFVRGEGDKDRLTGIFLVANMLATAIRTCWVLLRVNPDRVVIVKALPHNTLGVSLWYILSRVVRPKAKVILDVDDFELESNQLSSLLQRSAIHWAERVASKMSHNIVAATPFLADHYRFLTAGKKSVTLIPTGIDEQEPVHSTTASEQLAYFGSVSASSGHLITLLPDVLSTVRQTVPNASLLIAGDGHDTDVLRSAFSAASLDTAVTWHGRFSVTEVTKLLKDVAVLVDPVDASIAVRAKSSYRVMLASLHGLPCVTSEVGIRSMLVPNELHSRVFAKPGDAQDYGNKIANLITNPLTDAERQRLQTHVQQFVWPKLAQQYLKLL